MANGLNDLSKKTKLARGKSVSLSIYIFSPNYRIVIFSGKQKEQNKKKIPATKMKRDIETDHSTCTIFKKKDCFPINLTRDVFFFFSFWPVNRLRWSTVQHKISKKKPNNRSKILVNNFGRSRRKRKPLKRWYPLTVVNCSLSEVHCLKRADNK